MASVVFFPLLSLLSFKFHSPGLFISTVNVSLGDFCFRNKGFLLLTCELVDAGLRVGAVWAKGYTKTTVAIFAVYLWDATCSHPNAVYTDMLILWVYHF